MTVLFRFVYTRPSPPGPSSAFFLAAETTSLPPTTFLSLSLLTFLRLSTANPLWGLALLGLHPSCTPYETPSGRVLLAICRSLRWRYSLKGDGFRPAVTDAIIGWKLCIIVPGLLLIPPCRPRFGVIHPAASISNPPHGAQLPAAQPSFSNISSAREGGSEGRPNPTAGSYAIGSSGIMSPHCHLSPSPEGGNARARGLRGVVADASVLSTWEDALELGTQLSAQPRRDQDSCSFPTSVAQTCFKRSEPSAGKATRKCLICVSRCISICAVSLHALSPLLLSFLS